MTVRSLDSDYTNQPPGRFNLRAQLNAQINRGMPDSVAIRLRILWPLVILPFAAVNQILAPHAVWLVLVVALSGLFGIGLLWVRHQAPRVDALRTRTGTILVAGDTLREDFELRNYSRLPVLWAEFVDSSELPGHSTGRVVACGPYSFYRWRTEVVCERRGVFRLGPHKLRFADPFGLFDVEIRSDATDILLIYPRVVHLPEFELPHGTAGESRRRRRPLRGALPSASVVEYRPGDSLRHIHWRSTARASRLMVKELEIEPSGDVWIVLDLNRSVHSGAGPESTLEQSVIVAASIAAKLLSEGERRAVGLLTVSGQLQGSDGRRVIHDQDGSEPRETPTEWKDAGIDEQAVLVVPQPGQAQLWRILSALAPVEATDVTLAELLHNSRDVLGGRRTLIVVTAQTNVEVAGHGFVHHASENGSDGSRQGQQVHDEPVSEEPGDSRLDNWVSELVHLRSSGLDSSVILIASPDEQGNRDARVHTDVLRGLLATEDISSQVLYTDQAMQPALTFRRTRRVVRSTPTGGVVTYEVEEDVG